MKYSFRQAKRHCYVIRGAYSLRRNFFNSILFHHYDFIIYQIIQNHNDRLALTQESHVLEPPTCKKKIG